MTTMLALLTPDYADWELGLVAATARAHFGMTVLTTSPDGGLIVSASGLKVTTDLAFGDIDLGSIDCLLVIGGTMWEGVEAPDISELLRAAHDKRVVIGAICGGTRALAASGLIDTIAHTSNAADYISNIDGYHGGRHYVDTPSALRSGTIITAPGTAPVSFMKAVLDALGKGSDELDYYVGLHAAEHSDKARTAA